MDVDGHVGFWGFKKRLGAAALTAAALRLSRCRALQLVLPSCQLCSSAAKALVAEEKQEGLRWELPIMHSPVCRVCGLCLSCCGESVQICVQLGDAKESAGHFSMGFAEQWLLLIFSTTDRG